MPNYRNSKIKRCEQALKSILSINIKFSPQVVRLILSYSNEQSCLDIGIRNRSRCQSLLSNYSSGWRVWIQQDKVTANQDKWCFQFKHISEFDKLSLSPFKSVLPVPSGFLCIITDGINTNFKTSVRFSSSSNSWRHCPFKRFARKSIRSTFYHTGHHAY